MENIFEQLFFYGKLMEDDTICAMMEYIKQKNGPAEKKAMAALASSLVEKACALGLKGNLVKRYLIYRIVGDVNCYSLGCEKGILTESLEALAKEDIQKLFGFMQEKLLDNPALNDFIPPNEASLWEELYQAADETAFYNGLKNVYRQYGCGDFALYHMFRLANGRLEGIAHYDAIGFEDLIGYEYQKAALRENTEAFLQGFEANNVLLSGARGTGKSSCVKALANTYRADGLRLIEIGKEQIRQLPALLQQIKDRGLCFILFLDDLSFEDFEVDYKIMKSILEGGAEKKPANVLFYATTNRRNIIQEKWKDRDYDDVHLADSMNEKISLSDRFGLNITFSQPTPQEYVDMAWRMLQKAGCVMEKEEVRKLALRWELSQKGMSGRSARQFVNDYLWKQKMS